MKSSHLLVVAALSLCIMISCKKANDHHPTGGSADSTIKVNLSYLVADTSLGSRFELIISEPGGSVLLDTLATFNTSIVATLKTTKTIFDVTQVAHETRFDYYDVVVSMDVQPQKWTVLPGSFLSPLPDAYTPSEITYTNVPSPIDQNTIHFSSLPINTRTWNITSNANSVLNINYPGRTSGTNYAFISFPTLGRYNLHTIKGTNDTVSLAQMDTTVKVHYNFPTPWTFGVTYLTGYLDTTDLSKTLDLYNYWQSLPLADLQYPPKYAIPIQLYALDIDASTADNQYISYRSSGDAPAGTLNLPFPANPVYTLNSTQNNNLTVSFTQKPTSYGASYSTAKVGISFTLPPDSTHFQPLSFMNAINSKMLQGQSLSNMTIQNFNYETVGGGLDYSGFFLWQTNPAKNARPLSSELLYFKFMQ
jgi:hypothetical protein